jgi:hypothetical protein
MSDGSTENRQDDTVLRMAQAEDDLARAKADTVLDTAVSQAAHRDAADLVARNAAYIRHTTETALLNAKIREEQERADALKFSEEGGFLRRKLVSERKAASNATFGLGIVSVLLVIGSIAGGVYYFSSQNGAGNSASGAGTPGVVASVTPSSKSSDVSAPERTPSTIHVNPAPAGAEALGQGTNTESAVPPVSGSFGGSDTSDLTHGSPSMSTENLSGAALNNDSMKPVTDSASGNGDVILPTADPGTTTEPKTANP